MGNLLFIIKINVDEYYQNNTPYFNKSYLYK